MKLFRIGLVLAVLCSPVFGQNLVSLAPPGAVAGFILNDLSHNPYLRGVARDWAKSGLEAELRRAMGEQAADPALLGLISGGIAAALYPKTWHFWLRPWPLNALSATSAGSRLR
ncbi:MAG: hypothetical protein HZB27_10760 [Meiothermus silvanus]|nr:hypothetical protein [Allomeiothermus silvanus]